MSNPRLSHWVVDNSEAACTSAARLKFRNPSDNIHPLCLHRHSGQLVCVSGKPPAGVVENAVMLGAFMK